MDWDFVKIAAGIYVYTHARVRIFDMHFRTKGTGVPDMASFAELKKKFFS